MKAFPYSQDDVNNALASDATAVRILQKSKTPSKGMLVGVRLNLNVLKNTGVPVQTIHAATNRRGYQKNQGFYNGEAIDYAGGVLLKNAYFNVNQQAREDIASGRIAKNPMASIDGLFQEKRIESMPVDTVEVRFNPKDVHLFVDENNRALRKAEHVLVIGHRAYAWGDLEYYNELTAPLKMGDSPSKVLLDRLEHSRPTPSIVTAQSFNLC